MATEAQIVTAFKQGVRSIVGAARFGALRSAIERGDYESALRAVDIEDAAFDKLRAAIVETYAQGGVDTVSGMRLPFEVRWNSATPNAERFAREVVGGNITQITGDMRAAVRWQIGDSVALGRSANRTALDIVGRVGASGAREGGIVGLNEQRAKWVADLRYKLANGLSVDNGLLTSAERRLIERGELSPAQIDRIVQSYSNRQLLSRGKTIARTERGMAINMGRVEAWRQAVYKGGIPESALVKTWKHNGAHIHERITHMSASGDSVIGLNTPFQIGASLLQYPHDPTAPAREVINCDCTVNIALPKNWRQYG